MSVANIMMMAFLLTFILLYFMFFCWNEYGFSMEWHWGFDHDGHGGIIFLSSVGPDFFFSFFDYVRVQKVSSCLDFICWNVSCGSHTLLFLWYCLYNGLAGNHLSNLVFDGFTFVGHLYMLVWLVGL